MTDIMAVDTAKWKVRFFAWMLQKELTKMAKEHGMFVQKGKTVMDVVHDDLRTCPNRGVQKIYKKIIEAGAAMNEHYQTATIIDLVPFALWVAYHDTAYRDPLFWIMDELYKDPEFVKDIQPFVKPPKDWYCPSWHEAKENTEKKRMNGEIGGLQLAPDELVFSPEYMMARKNEELKLQAEMEKQLRLRDREP